MNALTFVALPCSVAKAIAFTIYYIALIEMTSYVMCDVTIMIKMCVCVCVCVCMCVCAYVRECVCVCVHVFCHCVYVQVGRWRSVQPCC